MDVILSFHDASFELGSGRACLLDFLVLVLHTLTHQIQIENSHKITSVRFFDGEKGIITSSADRRLKVWDISKQTYRQLNSIHLNSTANSIDVAFDSSTVVSGHADGGLRLWDIQTGQKKLEIEGKHGCCRSVFLLRVLDHVWNFV